MLFRFNGGARNGVPIRIIADTLGHSRTSVTMDVYAHVLPAQGVASDAGWPSPRHPSIGDFQFHGYGLQVVQSDSGFLMLNVPKLDGKSYLSALAS